jgi:hypothetical protein
MTISTGKKTVHKLGQSSHFFLCKWLETEELRIGGTYKSVGERAPIALQMKVNENNMRAAFMTLGKQMPRAADLTEAEKIIILTRAVDHLYVALGIPMPEALKSLL